MVVCTCGKPAVVKTSWTNRNPGRRFFGCPTIGSNCPFLGWLDPPMCPRSVDIIPGLLRRINAFRGVVEELEEQRSKYKKYIIISWVNMGKYEFAKSLSAPNHTHISPKHTDENQRKQPLTMAIYIGTEKEEWEKVLDIPYCMDLVLEGFGAEPIAEYGVYSKIPKDLRKQILTWLRKQPGYYEMLHLKNKKEKKEKERKEKEMKEKEMKKRKKKDDAEGSGSNF
ncbi:zinc finger, GRF-type [Artemisia annua]|uniref:Zinc finger, GRF-type n=1 Tax=Artemisia annua TaxID=35608 RepID=A0A2U1LYV9_ARTAN|nr:zinc finger, GRF-type [Artemisia annua]